MFCGYQMVILIQGFYIMFYLRHACTENYDSLPLVAPHFLYHSPLYFCFALYLILYFAILSSTTIRPQISFTNLGIE